MAVRLILRGYCAVIVLAACVVLSEQRCTHCAWSSWHPWSDCSAPCGGGYQERDRFICCDGHWSVASCLSECGRRESDRWQSRSCNTHCQNGGTFRNDRCNCREANIGSCCERTVECGHPGNIENGNVIGTRFYAGDSVTYTCNVNFNVTDGDWRRTCQRRDPPTIIGDWSGTQPRCAYVNYCESNPCQNEGDCVDDYDRYDCDCTRGWDGRHCELDILPPSLNNCQDDRQHFTSQIRKTVVWEEPEFYDEFGNDVTVTSNFPTPRSDLPWGDNTVKYTGRKENNALTTTCSFTEAIDPHPCEELPAPDNGAVACNGWNARFSRVCAYFCPEDLTFGPGKDIRQLLVCGAEGTWSPVLHRANCTQPRRRTKDDHHYTGSCRDAAGAIKDKYVRALTSARSPFHQLCGEFPDACAAEHVTVKCSYKRKEY